MKVLHIIDSGGFYGAEAMLVTLAEEQKRIGFYPIIASIGDKKSGVKTIEREAFKRGLEVEGFRMRPGPNIRGAKQILRYAQHAKIDILHAHGYKGNILFGLIPKTIRRLPLLTTLHGWTNTGRLNRMYLYERLDSFSLRFMDAVVLVSDFMKTHPNLRNRPELNIHVVPNGITAGRIDEKEDTIDSEVKSFCSQGPTLGSIGRLSTEKGHINLIKALKILSLNYTDLRLLVIGEGYLERQLIEKTEELGLGHMVMFAGYRKEAFRYLSMMNIFVLPSLTEGLPITLLESMRHGCPIVSTSVGGIPEALDYGVGGVLVPSNEPEKLAEAIRFILENPAKAAVMANKAKEIFRTRYSSQRMAERYTEIYQFIQPRR